MVSEKQVCARGRVCAMQTFSFSASRVTRHAACGAERLLFGVFGSDTLLPSVAKTLAKVVILNSTSKIRHVQEGPVHIHPILQHNSLHSFCAQVVDTLS